MDAEGAALLAAPPLHLYLELPSPPSVRARPPSAPRELQRHCLKI